MFKDNQRGAINVLLFPLIASVLLLIGAVVFGYWAFSGRQDYKEHSDAKSQVAVTAALKVEDSKKDAQFAEEAKSPLKTYTAPAAYGALKVAYPKTWSAYVVESTSDANSTDVDGYFYPDFVPDISNQDNSYALRIQILNQSYATTLQTFDSPVQSGTATVTPYTLTKLKSVVGSEVTGTISDQKTGTMVVLPLRDKTVEVWTEGNQFLDDFNKIILPNLTFSP